MNDASCKWLFVTQPLGNISTRECGERSWLDSLPTGFNAWYCCVLTWASNRIVLKLILLIYLLPTLYDTHTHTVHQRWFTGHLASQHKHRAVVVAEGADYQRHCQRNGLPTLKGGVPSRPQLICKSLFLPSSFSLDSEST